MNTVADSNGNILFSDYLNDKVGSLMFNSSCIYSLKIEEDLQDNILSQACAQDEILNKGLLTAMTFILENSRNIQETTELNGPNPESLKSGHDLLGSDIYLKTGKSTPPPAITFLNFFRVLLQIVQYRVEEHPLDHRRRN